MIRKATLNDLEQLKNIYNDAILHTVATFDTEVKDDKNRLQWFRDHEREPYVIFVEEREGVICGYCSLSQCVDLVKPLVAHILIHRCVAHLGIPELFILHPQA